MIATIVRRLKAGTITNVFPFGSNENPEPPYIVVKKEEDPLGRGYVVRIIGHMLPDNQIDLENYMTEDVSNLLSEFDITSLSGNTNQLDKGVDGFPVIIPGNDDGTIAMERSFLMPSIMF